MPRSTATVVLFASLATGALPIGAQSPPSNLQLPHYFGAPETTTSVSGATHIYRAKQAQDLLRLTITTIPRAVVRQQKSGLTPVQCINLFVDEIRKSHEEFFVAAMARPLIFAGREIPQFRWTGRSPAGAMTGVLGCGVINDMYVVVALSDRIGTAARRFPEVRASLRDLIP